MSNTEHAAHATPSLEWVMDKMAGKTAAPLTPLGAWLKLRGGHSAAVQAAEENLRSADSEQPVSAAAYTAAFQAVKVARAALRDFDRKNPKLHAEKVWKDVRADDPLLQAIFGGKS